MLFTQRPQRMIGGHVLVRGRGRWYAITVVILGALLPAGATATATATGDPATVRVVTGRYTYLLYQAGTAQDNHVAIGPADGAPGSLVVRDTGRTSTGAPVELVAGDGCANAGAQAVVCSVATPFNAFLGDGNDYATGREACPVACKATLHGGAGNDTLLANPGRADRDSRLFGGDGDDELRAGTGGSYVDAGAGADIVHGSSRFDHIIGGAGSDRLIGYEESDRILGNDGDDRIMDLPTLPAHGGDDYMSGGNGNDFITGGGGRDALYGGPGNDELWSYRGRDYVNGGSGVDWVDCAAGVQRRLDEEGIPKAWTSDCAHDGDRIVGGAGRDQLRGGPGNDWFTARDSTRDLLRGGPGKDEAEMDKRLDTAYWVEVFRY